MRPWKVYVFGPPRLEHAGRSVALNLRKALALLVYLVVTDEPQSRDALATLLWPDSDQREARARLRRTLYRLGEDLSDRLLITDQDLIRLNPDAHLWLDCAIFEQHVLAVPPDRRDLDAEALAHLKEAVALYTDDFLAGFTLPDSPAFDEWQFFQRERLRQSLARVLEHLVVVHQWQRAWEEAIGYARRWLALDPLHEPAQRALMQLYAWTGRHSAALRQYSELARLLDSELGTPPDTETVVLYEAIRARRLPPPASPPPAPREIILPPGAPLARPGPATRRDQQIRFCTAPDGVRIAYATVGHGPVLIKAANWLSHLEYDWHSPVWRHWIEGLSRQHTLVRYDERGCGLSDWNVDQFSLDAWVQDLETVVDTLGVERFPLLGISQGGPVALSYAVRHPERVSHLILYGTYARGRRKRDLTPDQTEEVETLLQLMRVGWGRDNPAFRQVFTTLFMPEATPEQVRSFNELQRISTSPENAIQFRLAFGHLDVEALAPQVMTPTLVLHAHADSVVPVDEARRLAALIPGASFVLLQGNNHILLEGEPAWTRFLTEVEAFLQSPAAPRPTYAMPPPQSRAAPATPFIGREREMADVRRLLADPDCRLVTLVGPGGIGKTRLALELVAALASDFPHGAHFVSLASVSAPDRLASVIAESLGLQLHGHQSPEAQLLDHLGDRRLLLALDNMEHLVAGADLLADILSHAPHLRLLVTSRERLNLPAEWNYEVRGMDYPTPPQLALLRLALAEAEPTALAGSWLREEIEHYSAVRLFVQRARQAQATFALLPADLPHVVHLCQLMEGMPLGLELAAPWVRSMTCEEIVLEVERNLDFLTSSLRHVPDRHRSLRAVFEQTWQRLSAQEQAVFSQMSVFQGHCTRAAATAVTHATLHDLSTLVDKALVRRDSAGHYTIHELIRHFGAEQLQAQPDSAQQTLIRFIAYYADFLHQRLPDLKGRRQLEAIAEIAADIDNIRAAWQQAVARRDGQALVQAAESLWIFSEYRGTLYECETDFRQAVETLADMSGQPTAPDTAGYQTLMGSLKAMQGMLRARRGELDASLRLVEQAMHLLQTARPYVQRLEANARMYLGYIHILSGNHRAASECAQAGLALYAEVGDRWGMGRCLQLLGNAAWIAGDADRAVEHLQACLAVCREIGDLRGSIYTYTGLANVALAHGSYAAAEAYLNQAYSLSQDFNDRIGQAQSLVGLSQLARVQGRTSLAVQRSQQALAVYESISYRHVAHALCQLGAALRLKGDLEAAHRTFQTSLAGARARGYPVAIAMCLSEMACLAYDQANYTQAADQFREALALWERLGNEPEIASVHRHLGHVGLALEADQGCSSQAEYRTALELALQHHLAPIALDVCTGVALLAARAGDLDQAVELLTLVERQPASTYQTRMSARQRLAELAAALSGQRVAAGQQHGPALDWQSTAQRLVERLSSPGP